MASGGPRAGNVLKCQLMPVAKAKSKGLYKATLTDAQLARLTQTFKTGVCDYSKPSTGYQKPSGTWQSFK